MSRITTGLKTPLVLQVTVRPVYKKKSIMDDFIRAILWICLSVGDTTATWANPEPDYFPSISKQIIYIRLLIVTNNQPSDYLTRLIIYSKRSWWFMIPLWGLTLLCISEVGHVNGVYSVTRITWDDEARVGIAKLTRPGRPDLLWGGSGWA